MIARLYRLALRAFPRRHRDLYGAEMIEIFARELEARRGSGVAALVRYVVAATFDAIATGVGERRRWQVVRSGYAFSSLDVTLAWRMLLRFPGLSLVSVFGMAVGIAVAATAFTVVTLLMDTRLPLPAGDRIVSMVSSGRRRTKSSASCRKALRSPSTIRSGSRGVSIQRPSSRAPDHG